MYEGKGNILCKVYSELNRYGCVPGPVVGDRQRNEWKQNKVGEVPSDNELSKVVIP